MEYLMRLFSVLCLFVLWALTPVYWLINRGKRNRVPPLTNPLLRLSATEVARKIRNREVSSETVVKAYIARIKEVDPILNAVVEDRFEEALKDARTCDKQIEGKEVNAFTLASEKPLFGVPFTVKESCGLGGYSYTGCSLVRKGVKAPEDGFVVDSLKRAGGIPLCVTNTPEFCCALETSNRLVGTVNNPYDVRRVAGGSSGGEGALLGAGGSLIGIGSDIAGSIRIPALFNGLFGHKPTPGIISIKGHYPISDSKTFQSYLVLGPMTRYADDLHLAVKAMSYKSKVDLRLDEPVDIKSLNVFYAEQFKDTIGLALPNKEMMSSVRRASKYLEECGARVRPDLKVMPNTCELCVTLFFYMEKMPHILINPDDPEHEKTCVGELMKTLIGTSPFCKTTIFMKLLKDTKGLISHSKLPQYQKEAAVLKQKLLSLLGENGVFLYPTYIEAAPYHTQTLLQLTAGMFCLLWNLLECPSTHVPMGLNSKGIPVGFQVVAAPHQDRLCLAVAKELEKGFGGWVPPNSK